MLDRVYQVSLVIAVVALTGLAEAQTYVTDGLIGFWTLDKSDIDGSTVIDVFGGNDGTIEGDPQTTEGKIEEGMEFDASEDRVEIPKDLMVGLESFTIECWFNYSNSSNWRWMFGGGPQWNHGVGCCIYSGSNIVRYHLKTDKGEYTDGNGLTQLTPGEWYHIAYTYNGKIAQSFVDGEIDFARAMTGAVAIDVSTLAIGAGYWDNNEYFAGILDEVRLYDRALDEDEAKQNFAVTSNAFAVDAVGKLTGTWGQIKSIRQFPR